MIQSVLTSVLSLLGRKSHKFSSTDVELHFKTQEICAVIPFISDAWVKLGGTGILFILTGSGT